MEKKKEKIEVDPEYIATSNALKIKELKDQQENKLSAEKFIQILNEIFDEELSTREKQLEEVQEKIFKAQKLLHIVRYVLITSYYKKSNLEVPPDEEVITPGFDKQNRIHPAVRKLLGNNPSLDIFCAGKGKRRVASKNCDKSGPKDVPSEVKKPKLDIKSEVPNPQASDQIILKNRKKTRHRLIIGNVSKWVPSLEDNTTHKWMMYVRGEKDNPDISHIVDKVIFHLHPSYKPHDVIEVRESPFHLSRRGWGEFPLRVQIFFKCPLNKPVSIVHNLKLEKTFTGRQTLGNETLVDVYLHDNSLVQKPATITKPPEEMINNNLNNSFNSIFQNFDTQVQEKTEFDSDYTPLDQTLIECEPPNEDYILVKSEVPDQTTTNVDLISTRSDSAYGCSDTASMSFEHDYCDVIEEQFVDNEIEMKVSRLYNAFLEHSYSIVSKTEDSDNEIVNQHTVTSHNVNINGEIGNKLIFGLGDNYLKESIPTVHNVVPKNLLLRPTEASRVFLMNNTVNEKQILRLKFGILLPQNRFKNIGEAMPYLLKRFPLWNDKVKNSNFKSLYPYIASSQEEFEKWPFSKKLNSEWNRAKEIKSILTERFPSLKKWSTRAIFMYARSHKFSPVISSSNFFKNKSEDLCLINKCFSEVEKGAVNVNKQFQIDVNVDIESDGDKSTSVRKKTYIDISDNSLKDQCAFVKETALDCGVMLRSEEISDGVIMNGAERMMLEAVKCLAEGLIRRAHHYLVCKKDYREGFSEVTSNEIELGMKERSEIQSIKEFQIKKREIDFFS
ncbi:uncharacterized protein LOC130440794 [Diorhabda sublineata]|uniref:uncharacterized protein LOC130440794 n=1 Tax=Diorhabda sublineata TaxID=1163346 RepID=UPI0024E140A6|nr:uncharacterized protein LOC130440794 [Diorhabda sublineata]